MRVGASLPGRVRTTDYLHCIHHTILNTQQINNALFLRKKKLAVFYTGASK